MIKSMIIAFAMYSKIPMVKVEWDDKSMRYALCFFPFIGLIIGAVSYILFNILNSIGVGVVAVAGVLTVIPLLITGGIHMDGFLDTMDAKSSYKTREEKLEILKDPHAGAFAIICGMVYMVIMYALFSEVDKIGVAVVAVGYIYSRALSGIGVVKFKNAKKTGLVSTFSKSADKRNVAIVLSIIAMLCVVTMVWINLFYGIVAAILAIMMMIYYRHMAYKIFGGITGDLAGYFLQMCEIVMLLGVVICKFI